MNLIKNNNNQVAQFNNRSPRETFLLQNLLINKILDPVSLNMKEYEGEDISYKELKNEIKQKIGPIDVSKIDGKKELQKSKKEKAREEKEKINDMFLEFHRTGDKAIRDKLIEKHLYLVDILAKRYVGRGIDYDDIYQVGSVGLILAVERFDPTKGYVFSSFATPTIIGEIKRHFRDKGWTIKVPRRIQELAKKISVAKTVLATELGRTPTAEDIAEYLDTNYETIIEAMEASKVYQPGSLDLSIDSSDDGNELFLSDLVGEDDPTYERVENLDYLRSELDKLNDIERTILVDRYIKNKTQISIARKLGISQMTVSRIEKKLIRSLRNEFKKKEKQKHSVREDSRKDSNK